MASSSSMTPVAASPNALTATALFAARLSSASSLTLGSGKASAGSRTPVILCIRPR